MPDNAHGAVVLLSGGIDSSVLIHHMARNTDYAPIHALSFNYGQRHVKELDCARAQAVSAGVHGHRVIDIGFLGALLAPGSTLLEGGADVPDLSTLAEEELEQPSTYVPNRNMMLLSMAAAYAEAQGLGHVFYGAQAQDEYGYWDCTRGFLDSMNAVLALNRRKAVVIHAPFIAKSKAENLRLGLELGVDFAQTWSCYRGQARPCATCPTCVERENAFRAIGAEDPLYAAAPEDSR